MMTKISLILLLLLICTVQQAYAWDWQMLHNEAEEWSQTKAQEVISSDPRSIETQYQAGIVLLWKHQYEQAKVIFEQILKQNNEYIGARWGLAEILRWHHKYDQSKKELNAIIKEVPDFAPARISLSKIKYTHLKLDEALEQATVVINLGMGQVDRRSYIHAHSLYSAVKGLLAYYGGPFSKTVNGSASLRHLRIVKNLAPKSFEYYMGFGNFYALAPRFFGGSIEKSEEYLLNAIELDPLYPDSYARLAQVYFKKGEEDKGNTYLKKAFELDPENEMALDVKNKTCKYVCLEQVK